MKKKPTVTLREDELRKALHVSRVWSWEDMIRYVESLRTLADVEENKKEALDTVSRVRDRRHERGFGWL